MHKKILIVVLLVLTLTLTGCTKYVKDDKGGIVRESTTGQSLVSNILCQPTDEKIIKNYTDHKVKISKLPTCEEFKPSNGGYEGIWSTLFIKPLSWLIIKIGMFVKNYGLAIIIVTLIIRLIIFPISKKSALQSENMKKASGDLQKLQNKYRNKKSQEDQMKQAQEMMAIYKKYGINPMSGCIFALIQIPLLFAFYEAMNRLPLIFEGSFIGMDLGMSPINGIGKGNFLYVFIIILVILTTYLSFKLNKTANTADAAGVNMKMMTNMSIGMIALASFSISTSIGIYWICNSTFTIIQNLLVKRGSSNA